MKVLSIYSRLYGKCMAEGLKSIGKSPWTLLLPMVLGIAMTALGMIIGGLPGLLQGIVFALALDALFSSYLYFVGEIVSKQRVSIGEFGRSFGKYFWSILNVMFVLWIVRFILSMVLRGSPQGQTIFLGLAIIAAIALNVVPEVIYQRGTYGGIQTFQVSWEFLKENWIEWFIPNVPFIALVIFVWLLSSALFPFGGAIIGGALLHVLMVFRGFLFEELYGSSHRQRMFRYRNA